ncbi:AraC family transcriptional regulator [Photobacterium sagamiensis]|uniref:helix-turn-helix domain-containing protein n=1 Tax=Photobacterium sagamiensis TaxID=2910241 RepID=UPI003D151EC2
MDQQDILGVELERLQVELEFTICTIAQLFDEFEPNVFAKPHRVSFNAIIYIVKGEGEHHIDHKLYRYKPGTIMFLSQYQVHHFDYNPDIEGYVVSFKDEMLYYGSDDPYECKIKTALENVNCIYNTDEEYGFYFEQLSQEYLNQKDSLSAEIIRSTIRTLMLKTLVRYHQSFLADQNRSSDALDFTQLRELIETHYHGTRTVADYARMMGKTTKKINQIVKDNTGRTGKELIDDRVILEAKRLLAYSQYSIANIASILGFNEATNMTKFFRRHTELTPKEFRELCRHNVAKNY